MGLRPGKSLTTDPRKSIQTKQFNEVIKVFLEDITDLKNEMNNFKAENNRLTEVIMKN